MTSFDIKIIDILFSNTVNKKKKLYVPDSRYFLEEYSVYNNHGRDSFTFDFTQYLKNELHVFFIRNLDQHLVLKVS